MTKSYIPTMGAKIEFIQLNNNFKFVQINQNSNNDKNNKVKTRIKKYLYQQHSTNLLSFNK